MIKKIALSTLLIVSPIAQSAVINADIAKSYNDGLVRCTNAECAKYLYACFRTYSASTLQEFLACGSQASRLNNNQRVVSNP